MAQGPYRADLDGALAPFVEVPFGDLAALDKALARRDVAAFIVEPIQVEAGVRIAPPGYLEASRDACHRAGALFMVDEVQTGLGRTGTLFASPSAAMPDVLVLAKALGGGLVPIGATLLGDGLWQRAYGTHLKAEIHASTFGGNSLACRVALAMLDLVDDEAFLAGVRTQGAALFGALETALAASPWVERVSWRGLVGGIALRATRHPWLAWENLGLPELAAQPVAGALVVERLARRSILAQVCAHDWSVVRVQPPLTVDEAVCARFVAAVTDAIAWLGDNE
jgi:acetylornithine/succinyldiaminopimelate/putrescine aminotransferase